MRNSEILALLSEDKILGLCNSKILFSIKITKLSFTSQSGLTRFYDVITRNLVF